MIPEKSPWAITQLGEGTALVEEEVFSFAYGSNLMGITRGHLGGNLVDVRQGHLRNLGELRLSQLQDRPWPP